MRSRLAVLAFLLAAPLLRADVVVLVNGDRVTGRVIGKITRRVRVQTPYGALVIPADKVERIRRDDGSEEVLNVPPAPDRLSTTTCWLHIRLSRSVIRRAMMSGEPPAGKGTM